jgi:hypothetical protein
MGGSRIPPHTQDGVLPPWLGRETARSCSPYRVDLAEVVERFGTSRNRCSILEGLLRYRGMLRAEGATGTQWLDGGFLDIKDEEPKDIDLLTLLRDHPAWTAEKLAEFSARPGIVTPGSIELYRCDAYFIELDRTPLHLLPREIAYWLGVFSHTRNGIRRGLLEIPLTLDDSEDEAARVMLRREGENPA